MTPPPVAIAEEVSNNRLLSKQWMVGGLATGSLFHPALETDSLAPRFHYYPENQAGIYVAPAFPEPFESISSQALFASDESAPAPSSELTEPLVQLAPWIEPVLGRSGELMALPADWDHHGAAPISTGDLLAAFRLLQKIMLPNTPPPAIVPLSGGGIQLEWHRAGLDVELLITDQSPDQLYLWEIESEREWEGPAEAGFAEHSLAERLAD